MFLNFLKTFITANDLCSFTEFHMISMDDGKQFFSRKHRNMHIKNRVHDSYKVLGGTTCRADMRGVMG